MIVNGATLKVYADIMSKVDAMVVYYTGSDFVLDNKNAIVVIRDDFIRKKTKFNVHRKLIVDVLSLLGKDSIDYQVYMSQGVIRFEGNGREVSVMIEEIERIDIDKLQHEEMKKIDIDIAKITEVGKFSDGRLNDIFEYVYLLDDGVYGGSESFFTRIKDKIDISKPVGVDPKIVEILKNGNVIDIGVAEDNSFLWMYGEIEGMNIELMCRVAMLEESKQEVFKNIFVRPEVIARAEVDGGRMKEVVSRMLDPVRDEVMLYCAGNDIKYKFVKSAVKWDDNFGRLISGEWRDVSLLGRDFMKLVERTGLIENCGNRMYLRGDNGFEAVCAVLQS